jgi:hypothetical protein
MIVGAPKAGTTSLIDYLGQHPQIVAHRQREFIFFASDQAYAMGYERAWNLYFGDAARSARARVGKSVAMMYSRPGLERLRAHNPAVQLVLVLRDPVYRAYSEFWYARRRGWESEQTFEAALDREMHAVDQDPTRHNAYLARGRYSPYLDCIYELFPREQVNVLLFEELKEDPLRSCQALYRRLAGVDADFTPAAGHRRNAAAQVRSRQVLRVLTDHSYLPALRQFARVALGERARQRLRSTLQQANERPFTAPTMPDAVRQQLAEYFAPPNRALQALLQRSLDRWVFPARSPDAAATQS